MKYSDENIILDINLSIIFMEYNGEELNFNRIFMCHMCISSYT